MKKLILAGVALFGMFSANAQNEMLDEFEQFRSGILSDFQEFRQTILDHYADFLEGTWHEYEPLVPMEKYKFPKPSEMPNTKIDKPSTKPVKLPSPVLAFSPDAIKPNLPKLVDVDKSGNSRLGLDAKPAGADRIDPMSTNAGKLGDADKSGKSKLDLNARPDGTAKTDPLQSNVGKLGGVDKSGNANIGRSASVPTGNETISHMGKSTPKLGNVDKSANSSIGKSANVPTGNEKINQMGRSTPKLGNVDKSGNSSIGKSASVPTGNETIGQMGGNVPKLGNTGNLGNSQLNTSAGGNTVANMPSNLFPIPKTEVPIEAKNVVPLTLALAPALGVPILGGMPKLPIGLPKIKPMVEPIKEEETQEVPEEKAPEAADEIVNFYGMELAVPKVDFNMMASLEKVSDFARQWKALDEQNVAAEVIEALQPKMAEWGLNDYLTMEFLCAYFDSKFPQLSLTSKLSGVHYIIANLGFNARLSVATKTGDPVILIPAEQKLYGMTYLKINGQNFYVLGNRNAKIAGSPLATCDLPKGAASGKKFNMRINGLNLPRQDRPFEVKYKDMVLTGTVNENVMPVIYRYPQMDTADYAQSFIDGKMRDDLVKQMKEQLEGKEDLTAVNDLLEFVQSGFEYATDGDFHGFEKPYFLEENFFYPKNDCEDRSIFYTFMLWHALGMENHLLAFPGHESASVSLPGRELSGTSYMHEGKRFYISDPTYIGSRTGQCMRQFEQTGPTIDYIYGNK